MKCKFKNLSNHFFSFFLTFLIITCTSCIFTGCNKKDNSDNKTVKLTLNEVTHSIFYAPQYVAIENGYFEEEGIELTVQTGFGSDKVMTALISGDADIGLMGPESSVYVYSEGSSEPAVTFAQLTQRAGNFLISRQPETDFKWENLKGKTIIGGRPGGMPEMLLEYILQKNGLDPKSDVTIMQNIDFGSTAAAFSSNVGDYTVEFEPTATLLENQGDGYVVASLGVDSGYVPYTAYCAKKSYLNNNHDAVQGFTNALQKGIDYVNSHTPQETAAVIAPQFPETDTDTIAKIVERYKNQDTWKNDTVFEESSFTLLTDILKNAGELNSTVPYDDLINTEFAKAAKNSH